ncbi:MAG: hypothetical protein ACRD3W_13080 [Terriglobales bacterium]
MTTKTLKPTTEQAVAPPAQVKKVFARKAAQSSVVIALPQPGGADLARAKKELKQS